MAHYLGNTPAVCRKSYVDPRVVDRYRAGVTIAAVLSQEHAEAGAIESAVLNLLEDAPAAALTGEAIRASPGSGPVGDQLGGCLGVVADWCDFLEIGDLEESSER